MTLQKASWVFFWQLYGRPLLEENAQLNWSCTLHFVNFLGRQYVEWRSGAQGLEPINFGLGLAEGGQFTRNW